MERPRQTAGAHWGELDRAGGGQAPTPVDRSTITPPKKAIGDWTIAEKLAAIVMHAADSENLPLETQQQLKGKLSDPNFLAWLVGSLLVWFVSQFFVFGEILDMLLAGAALVLSGAGIFFARNRWSRHPSGRSSSSRPREPPGRKRP